MDGNLFSFGFRNACYLIEVGLLFYLARHGQLKKQGGLTLYLVCLVATGFWRTCVLHAYGLASPQYCSVYWGTDLLLVISAFILVCFFFRRACAQEEKMWKFVRRLLIFSFVAVVGISILSFTRNHTHLKGSFLVEFNQNLYFTCLMLNTLLYILLQQIESTDEQLGLLVCGTGIQFAGPAASLALVHLTTGEGFFKSLLYFTIPLCTLGMLMVWAYATVRTQGRATKVPRYKAPVLAEVTVDLNV